MGSYFPGMDERRTGAARFEVRAAQPEDADRIASVLHAAFEAFRPQYTDAAFDATVLDEPRIRERLRQGPGWLAIKNGVPVGTVSAVLTPHGLYVRGMAVIAPARGHGIGTALLNQVERFAVAARAPRVFLSTTPFLDAAIALYERCGFVRCSDPPHALHGTPLFTMQKALVATGAWRPPPKT
ncbi:MAG TPA: GNAT family N-acetyltransferase [Chloroflexota bacterium]|jgi:GNAT superfamily N-acetyltransferase|nr:GNAT family N-acetyltransferase [Chloroflexota bacterium]